MNKKFASLGLTLGLAAGGVAGLAFGNPSVSGAVTSPAAADATAATDTTTTADRPDPSVRLAEVLAPLVADGTLTQAQLDSVVATLAEAGPLGGGHRGGMRGGGPGLEAAATALGVTEDELRTELQDGSTIAEVAAAKGVDVQTVIDAMVASATEHINSEVASGEHTQEEADAKLADLATKITERVNSAMPEGGRGGHGPRGDRADSADAAADDDSTSTTIG